MRIAGSPITRVLPLTDNPLEAPVLPTAPTPITPVTAQPRPSGGGTATRQGDLSLQSNLRQQQLLAQLPTPAEQRELSGRVRADDAQIRQSLDQTLTGLDQSLGTLPGYTDRLRARVAATSDGTLSGVAADLTVTSGRVAGTARVTHTQGPEGGTTTAGAEVTVGLGRSTADVEAEQKQRAAESTALTTLGTGVTSFMDALDKVSSSGASPQEKARMVQQQLLPRLEILGTLAASSAYGSTLDGSVSPRFQQLATSLVDAPMSVMRDLVEAGGGNTARLDARGLIDRATAPVRP